MANWSATDIPSMEGRTALVTGTGGLGLEDAVALARVGCGVIVAGRNPGKGAEAVARVRAAAPGARVTFEHVDLASLQSVAALAARLLDQEERLDLLINNAAVMTPPTRQSTDDGFELQFGTNYLGHFALTARLLPLLRRTPGARVVTLSSVAARSAAIDFTDLQAERSYAPMRAYGQSKLACLMFGLEMHRRSVASDWGIASVPAHPGISRTDLLHNAPGRWSAAGMARTFLWFLFQPAAAGALPTLFAATDPTATSGTYYGPRWLGETRGPPGPAQVPPQALDLDVAARLWAVSEELCGVEFA